MKHIHLVTPYESVAMRRMYEPLVMELSKLYTITYSGEVDISADLNYHIPWHTMIGYAGGGKHAIAYTHCNAGAEASVIDACQRADLITCMTFTGRQELIDLGVDPSKIWVIYAAADQHVFRRKIIGIVGYPQPNGRKRESLLLDLAWQYDMTPFQFIFTGGAGWEDIVTKLNASGVAAAAFHAETDDQLRAFYGQIDLLLVTGYREGGPLPILEAMASGTEILSPKFGYAKDLLDEANCYSTVEELAEKLEEFASPFVSRHKLARAWRWQDYCSEHALIFGRFLGESVDLYPQSGASRYAQLLDVIDQEQPQSIVEIGTWSGNRAIQMIQAASKYLPVQEVDYQGFDLFESQTAEQLRVELSKPGWDRDIIHKRVGATGANIDLIAGNTIDTLQHVNSADFYFVDGGHSERTIDNDGSAVLDQLSPTATAVFDDYYHVGQPRGMGCNKFIDSLDPEDFEVTHLPARTMTDDGRDIGMVKVKRNAHIYL